MGIFDILKPNFEKLEAHKKIEELVQLMKSDNPDIRDRAADILGTLRDPRAVPHLLEATKSEDQFLRRRAVDAIGQIGDASAVDPLIDILINHEDPLLRRCAAEALGDIQDVKALDPLIKALRSEDSFLQAESAYALGKLGSEIAIDYLVDALKSDKQYIRYAAAVSLKKLKWEPRTDDELRYHLFATLQWSKLIQQGNKIESILSPALEDENPDIRIEVARILGILGNKQGVRYLINQLETGEEFYKEQAATILGEIRDPEAVRPLISLASATAKQPISVERKAVEALCKIGPPAVESLIGALGLDDMQLKENAVEALGIIGDERAIKPLLTLLESEYMHYNRGKPSEARALERIGKAAVEPIIYYLRHIDPNLRCIAAEMLGRIDDPRAVSFMQHALTWDQEDVRIALVQSLGEMNSMEAELALKQALTQQSGRVRGAAKEALAAIENRRRQALRQK